MTANAPYYQMRSGQVITTPNSTNAAPPQFVAEEDEYDLSGPAAVAAPLDHHLNPYRYSEHTARQTSIDHTLEGNHNLVELLEAATAAGHAAQVMDISNTEMSTATPQGRSKRKRHTSPPVEDSSYQTDEPVHTRRRRRRRHGEHTDPRLQDGDRLTRRGSPEGNALSSSESLLNNARAAGVHSAAALFRRSSEKTSRKYARPPMSKLFMSLQLSPENFLQLQAAAKSYMLDAAYPERQNCVGNRGKGDTDMVKLRLFNCVRDFLNDGVGEQFFGEHVEKPGVKDAIEAARALGEEEAPDASQRLTWPRDGNKIIGLVIPLMRRMVTNERQRQYAIETRKGSSKKKDKEDSAEAVIQQDENEGESGLEHNLQPAFDPTLIHHLQSSQPDLPPAITHAAPPQYSCRNEIGVAGSDQKVESHGSAKSIVKVSGSLASLFTFVLHANAIQSPTSSNADPDLSHINVFLVQPSSGTRASIKLDERRITAEPQTHLAWYDYNDFVQEVICLLKIAMRKHPELNLGAGSQVEPGTDSLRGLAAAANALQTEHVHQEPSVMGKSAGATGLQNPSAGNVSPRLPSSTSAVALTLMTGIHSDSDAKLLSRCVVKSIGPGGWREIRSAEDWYSMLREKAFAIWADGVCNVLVEVVDPPAVAA